MMQNLRFVLRKCTVLIQKTRDKYIRNKSLYFTVNLYYFNVKNTNNSVINCTYPKQLGNFEIKLSQNIIIRNALSSREAITVEEQNCTDHNSTFIIFSPNSLGTVVN